jgi:hypothetical protein
MEIDWNKFADGTADLKYTIIKPEIPENGGYIFYGTTLNDLNRFYRIYNKTSDNLTQIEWSSVNKNGHVKDQHHFGDADWHCWNELLMDTVCQ